MTTVDMRSGYDIDYPTRGARGMGGQATGEKTAGGYYLNAAQAGEAAGLWSGRGAAALGMSAGKEVDKDTFHKVYSQVDPRTGEQLGRKPIDYAKHKEGILARLLSAEPHATTERVRELERQAERQCRRSAVYTDCTVGLVKSASVFHASIRENMRRAGEAGDARGIAFWEAQEGLYQQVLQEANAAALAHLQEWAVTRVTGQSHGVRVGTREVARYETAGLVITSWLQGTSRDGDPHDHIHNAIARMAHTDADGKWRAVDTMAMREQARAMKAIFIAHMEAGLSGAFGVRWDPRVTSNGDRVREIRGVTQAQMDAYSSRAVAVDAKRKELAESFAGKYGRTPNRREMKHLHDQAWELTRKGKEPAQIDWDAMAAQWDAKLGGELAQIAPAVSHVGTGTGQSHTQGSHTAPEVTHVQKSHTAEMALCAVQSRLATWTRSDLMGEVAAWLPAEAQQMTPAAAVALVHEITGLAMSGEVQAVRPMDAPEYPATPEYLVRELDGQSIYSRPGAQRFATEVQVSGEELLVDIARGAAPVLSAAESAGMLSTSVEALEVAGQTHAHEADGILPGGLRMDQAEALSHTLADGHTVSVVVGPAGSGKTRVLAEAAKLWSASGRAVVGIAPSQAARNVLAKASSVQAWNCAQFLGHSQAERGKYGARDLEAETLILLDEGSMISTQDMQDIVRWAAEHDCKVLLAGDHGQLTAVEGGGGMQLLARELGYAQLATPVRFRADWERDASLRLRAGDGSVLAEEYDQHGRLSGGTGEEALEKARRAYVAAYLEGRDVLLMARSHEVCGQLSRWIREDLVHLGLVSDGPAVKIRGGQVASVGDVIITRENDHSKGIANGDTWVITSIQDSGQVVMYQVGDADPVTGARTVSDRGVLFGAFDTAELGYAITAHSAQGRTVAEGHAVITGGEDREWIYVAMSRGMFWNGAYVVETPKTADPKAPTRPAPELERYGQMELERAGLPEIPAAGDQEETHRDYLAVMADALDRPGAEMSAMETRATNLANADHLGVLHAIFQSEAGPVRTAAYVALVREMLPAGWESEPVSHKATWLWRSLRMAEAAGLDARQVIGQAIERTPLTGVRDVWAVIDARVRDATASLVPATPGPWAGRVPESPDEAQQDYLNRLAVAMDQRADRLAEHLADTAPAWAVRALGPVPEDDDGRAAWTARVKPIGVYREQHGYDHALDAIGPEPNGDSPETRQAWHAAFASLGPVDGVDLRGQHDGSLRLMRGTYEPETRWAPRHVGAELREVRLGIAEAQARVRRASAMAKISRNRGDEEAALRHEATVQDAQALAGAYQARDVDLADTMAARREWEIATEGTRRLAVAADTELRRRHPGVRFDPLQSAEPPVPTEAERAELSSARTPAWVEELAGRNRAARAELDDRRSQRIPDEDHEYADAEAWPEMISKERDAVLQPPRTEILPAPEVVRLADVQEGQPDAEQEPGE